MNTVVKVIDFMQGKEVRHYNPGFKTSLRGRKTFYSIRKTRFRYKINSGVWPKGLAIGGNQYIYLNPENNNGI